MPAFQISFRGDCTNSIVLIQATLISTVKKSVIKINPCINRQCYKKVLLPCLTHPFSISPSRHWFRQAKRSISPLHLKVNPERCQKGLTKYEYCLFSTPLPSTQLWALTQAHSTFCAIYFTNTHKKQLEYMFWLVQMLNIQIHCHFRMYAKQQSFPLLMQRLCRSPSHFSPPFQASTRTPRPNAQKAFKLQSTTELTEINASWVPK